MIAFHWILTESWLFRSCKHGRILAERYDHHLNEAQQVRHVLKLQVLCCIDQEEDEDPLTGCQSCK